jgi:hypothetical protein
MSPSSRRPTKALTVSAIGTSGFGQCSSSRSIWSTARDASERSADRRRSSGAASPSQTFVVSQMSSRGTGESAIPRPTSASLPYMKAVSMWR